MTLRRQHVEISTVTPMCNERLCAREFVRRVDVVLRLLTDDYEIIVVDDGSTDGTGELLDEVAATYSRLQVVHLSRSFGQATATDTGFQQSSGDFVVMLDGDLEQPPEEIPHLIEKARQGFDLVSGWRTKRKVNRWLRLMPSHVANWMLRRATGCKVRDMGGIKCLRGEMARSLRLWPGQHRFLPALVHVLGGLVTEVPVASEPRFAGQSHYGVGRTLDVFLDIAHFWFQTACKGRPIYLFGRMSLGLIAMTSLLLIGAIVGFTGGATSLAWPLLLVCCGLGFSSGVFLALGVALELLSETHAALIDRRQFRIAANDTEHVDPVAVPRPKIVRQTLHRAA